MAIIGLAVTSLLGPFGSYLDFGQRQESERRLKELKLAFTEGYRRELMTLDAGVAGSVTLGGVTIANNSVMTPAMLAPIERYASLSAARMATDGFNMPHRLFVSNQLSQTLAGTPLIYRVIAIVSAGKNGVVDSTFDSVIGTFAIGADDMAEIINGYSLIREAHDEAAKKLQQIAAAYQNYFLTRYQASATRSVAVDYFASSDPGGALSESWDANGSVQTTAGSAVNPNGINLAPALGLAATDLMTSLGPILIDNSSTNVNHPDHPTPSRTLPPYSAQVIAPLPGGNQLALSVTGVYN